MSFVTLSKVFILSWSKLRNKVPASKLFSAFSQRYVFVGVMRLNGILCESSPFPDSCFGAQVRVIIRFCVFSIVVKNLSWEPGEQFSGRERLCFLWHCISSSDPRYSSGKTNWMFLFLRTIQSAKMWRWYLIFFQSKPFFRWEMFTIFRHGFYCSSVQMLAFSIEDNYHGAIFENSSAEP